MMENNLIVFHFMSFGNDDKIVVAMTIDEDFVEMMSVIKMMVVVRDKNYYPKE